MSKNKGYIPISRGLFEHSFWCEERCYSRFEAWFYLLKEARFEDTKLYLANKVFVVKRGQISVSLRYLTIAWGWSIKKVRLFLELLKSDDMVTIEVPKGTAQTLITICNYDNYNKNDAIEGHSKGTVGAQQGHSRGTNINNLNKDNKDNNKDIPPNPQGGCDSFSQNSNLDSSSSEKDKSKNPKTEKEKSCAKKEKEEMKLMLDALSTQWREVVDDWIKYKELHNEAYKIARGLRLFISKLKNLSNNDVQVARKIIDQAFEKRWKGIFPLKNEIDYENKSSKRGSVSNIPTTTDGYNTSIEV